MLVLCQKIVVGRRGSRVTGEKDSYFTWIRKNFMTFPIKNLSSTGKVPFLCHMCYLFVPSSHKELLNFFLYSPKQFTCHSKLTYLAREQRCTLEVKANLHLWFTVQLWLHSCKPCNWTIFLRSLNNHIIFFSELLQMDLLHGSLWHHLCPPIVYSLHNKQDDLFFSPFWKSKATLSWRFSWQGSSGCGMLPFLVINAVFLQSPPPPKPHGTKQLLKSPLLPPTFLFPFFYFLLLKLFLLTYTWYTI